jgi:murein DD-endopeptidase MepM/ murein hydrolase activator NlpD
MKPRRVTILWMPSASAKSRILSLPPVLIYFFAIMFCLSWVLLLVGGYLGNRLYHDYCELRQQNSHLLQKDKELQALRSAMEQIRKDEKVIRSFLGLEEAENGRLGQGGGMPSTNLSTVAPTEEMASQRVVVSPQSRTETTMDRAAFLQASLHELVETVQDRRELWDSTPSIVPVKTDDYWFSSGFGWRRSPFTGLKEFHNGLDISSRKGTPIIAPARGVVVKRGYDKYLGKYLQLDHGRNTTTTYGHLSGYSVSCGQNVERGQVIASMGNTGLSTGHHLHYMVKTDNRCVNPMHYILNAEASHLLVRPLQADGGG